MKFLIFVPTYNECKNVKPLAKRLLALELSADILFIDDCSPDGTGYILDELADMSGNIHVIHRQEKAGIGSAHMEAIKYACQYNYDLLVTMDGDLTHSPEDIPRLLEAGTNHDVVIGSRFAAESRMARQQPLQRRLVSGLSHLATRVLLGLSYDATNAFRVYRPAAIPHDFFSKIHSPGYAFFFESLFFLAKNSLRIIEMPVGLSARYAGSSKMNLKEVLKWSISMASLRWQIARDR